MVLQKQIKLSDYYVKIHGNTANKNVVTDGRGDISLENKPDIPTKTSDLTNDGSDGTDTYVESEDLSAVATSNSYNDLDNKPSDATTSASGFMSASDKTKLNGIATNANNYSHPSTHESSMITDSNTYSNIGINTASTLDNILSNIDNKLGALASVELVEVTGNKGTASASTMNKLYLVAESSSATNDNYEIFITVRTGTSPNYTYSWEKVDTARIDLSGYLTKSEAQQTYQPVGNYLTSHQPLPTIVNDLTTGGTTSVLSAEQGKTLQNNKLNNTLSNDVSSGETVNKMLVTVGSTNTIKTATISSQIEAIIDSLINEANS